MAIATPAGTHAALVREALEADKDVLVEKPICLAVDEARELTALADARGRVLMVGHLLWYHPAVLRLRELVAAGRLGRLQYLYSNRLNLGRIRREENISGPSRPTTSRSSWDSWERPRTRSRPAAGTISTTTSPT